MSEYEITYDAALKSYILSITGVESAYTPKVYDIEKQGSSKILSVGYIGSLAWAQIEDGQYTAPEPDKYMKITLRERSGGMMYVSSIQAVDGQEVIGTTEPTREPETEEETTTAVEETTVAVTEVPVTDENGEIVTTEPVTDENGEVVTAESTAETDETENDSEEDQSTGE
jgi:asparagine N-glycosylation enzyme membrane subunit Stt3